MSKIFKYELQILERHLDTFGHVNNATYLEIFEEARWDIVANAGYGIERVKKSGIGPVILGVEVRFRKELKVREEIVVETEWKQYRRRVGKIYQRIVNKEGALCADALFTAGLFDLKERKLVAPTSEWLKAIQWEGPTS